MDKDLEKKLGLAPIVPQIKLRAMDNLLPYANNSRTHSPAQVALLERLLEEFGWTSPILVEADGIVAGHGRCMAAANVWKRGGVIRFPNGSMLPPGQVPTIDCDGWTQEQRRAYIIADNASAEHAGWDEDMLAIELKELEAANYDLELTALDDSFLAELLAEGPPVTDKDPDAAPEAPDVPVSEPGDVWVLGAHRVCCGSSTEDADWDRLMQGEQADVVWTDPPYNVDQGRKNRELDKVDGGSRSKTGSILNDNMSESDFVQFLNDVFAALFPVMKAGGPIYVAHPQGPDGRHFWNAMLDCGIKIQTQLIWRKNVMVLGRLDYQAIHEPIIYGWKPGSAHRWYGGRKNTSVIDLGDSSPFQRMEDGRYQIKIGDSVLIVSGDAQVEEHPSSVIYEPKPAKSGLHPTQKPVALVERMLKQSARTGDIVVDAFGGSGTTLLAADRLGMCARLMELDPRFVDVIVKRWQDYTGRRATHATTGLPFPADGEVRAAPPVPEQQPDHDIF